MGAAKLEAWTEVVPPPMTIVPGLFSFSPRRKSKLSGNGSTGGACWLLAAPEYPKVAIFKMVGEKMCVSCALRV